jgi:hypothetical protein
MILTNREPKYFFDYFIYKKNFHWFVIPTIVIYYNKHAFVENNSTTLSFGVSLRWLIYFGGIQLQKNVNYKKIIK